jgi:hypothetical protein
MKLTSVKRTKDELKPVEAPSKAQESYPYGLELRLEKDVIDKLGIKPLPGVGAVMVLQAKVKVVRVSASESGTSNSRSIDLQITSMGLEPEKSAPAPSEILWKK